MSTDVERLNDLCQKLLNRLDAGESAFRGEDFAWATRRLLACWKHLECVEGNADAYRATIDQQRARIALLEAELRSRGELRLIDE